MDDVAEAAPLLKIAVEKLRVGMFVDSMDGSNKQISIANAGQIHDRAAILKLRRSGISHVWVDVERSSNDSGLKMPVSNPTLAVKKLAKDRVTNIKHAKALMAEAKGLLQKVMSETFEGKMVEVEPFEDLADSMIVAVLRDPDALKCVSALRTKNAYLLEHSVNVAFLLVTFGGYLGLEREVLRKLAIGGFLHDVGKIRVDCNILNKPDKLSDEEFEQVKLHQNYAIEIMDKAQGVSQISKDICLMHHEKLDGTGYPRGLSGDDIPLYGRMSCIVDIFDALTAARCYKEAMSPARAFKMLLSLTPFHLDEALVYDFIRCVGVYPVGSLVELSDGRVGIVWESTPNNVLHPKVKCFYSNFQKRYTEVVIVDLQQSDFYIEKGISPSSLPVDPAPFY
ncbi:HD-GYP domain-containing protein [Shewanella youngdeokensis]|uniref:HD-GYP domain-containing protein n=1 Tax=Shewanella youngdeokensis TaxID=2999068 RepID=A0ABZ0JYH8_9GAMM|nr:HD-GYP domain-containing protein [Shewanella sp. DAU334]